MTETAVGFGYKAVWLAVGDRPADVIADTLRLRKTRPISWAEGVAAAYQGGVLVTPPVDGWTFVLTQPGRVVLDPSAKGFVDWFSRLSARLGAVRCFITHRVVEFHGWARAEGGTVERVHCHLGESGELLADIGPRTVEEAALGIGRPDDMPGEHDVMRLADLWSVSPGDIDGRAVPGRCLIGHPPRWRAGRL